MKHFILVLVMVVVVSGATVGSFINTPNNNEGPVRVEIKRGDTINALAQQWQQDGWLHSAMVMKGFARFFPINLRPGEYDIPAKLTAAQLLDYLNSAKAINYRVQLIEGHTTRDALQRLATSEHVEIDIAPLTTAKVAELLAINNSLEGWLFPDTYIISKNERLSSVLQQAYQRMQQVLEEEWSKRAPNLPYKTPYEALIMASIVEKETAVPDERSRIAGVFVRRLNKGMRLETDPTVMYGLGPDFNGNLTRRHLRDDSNLHNTYRHFGLPPTPIALAGREAIHAALHPADGDEIFFVAKGDGSHYFSKTLAEHNRAVRRYQLQRRADYRSTPE